MVERKRELGRVKSQLSDLARGDAFPAIAELLSSKAENLRTPRRTPVSCGSRPSDGIPRHSSPSASRKALACARRPREDVSQVADIRSGYQHSIHFRAAAQLFRGCKIWGMLYCVATSRAFCGPAAIAPRPCNFSARAKPGISRRTACNPNLQSQIEP